jgi:two-component sensor histidine kinase
VKNNLQIIYSLLDLHSARIDEPQALEMVLESQNRIRSMAQIHQTLYESQDFAKVDFSSFLEAFVPQVVVSYALKTTNVDLVIDAEKLALPINAAIPCGLVVNELVSNALKHGFPGGRGGRIAVRLAQEPDGRIALSISDDGIGLPDGFDSGPPDTLGLQLVSMLADQVGAEFTIHPAAPTSFTLRFPVKG